MIYSENEWIQWLERLTYQNFQENSWKAKHILITTIDNPGWGVTIDLQGDFSSINLPLADVTNSENAWYYCTIKENNFEGDGGLFNLEDIFYIFKQFINYRISNYNTHSQKMFLNKDLAWLIQWFADQCDGWWEHANGIKMGTTINPGWYLKVSTHETPLEHKDF